MPKKIVTFSLCLSLLLLSSAFAPCTFAASVETVGDLKVNGEIESTGGFKFPDGTTLSGAGDITANSSSAAFQVTQQGSGHGIDVTSHSGDAINASAYNNGIFSASTNANGILGYTDASSRDNAGIFGSSHGTASGIYGQSTGDGYGVRGSSSTGDAIHGDSGGTGVYGASTGSIGVLGYTTATGAQNAGVKGLSESSANGVYGEGRSTGPGVYAENNTSTGYALRAKNSSVNGVAGHFDGNVESTGVVSGASASFSGSAINGIYVNTSYAGGNGILAIANTGAAAYGVYGSSNSGYGVVGGANGAALAGGRFVSSASNGVALVAESGATQIMRVDGTGVTVHGNVVASGTITGTLAAGAIADGSVTSAKLANGAVTSAKINVDGNFSLNSNDLKLLYGDTLHGLGWYGADKLFAGANVDGPALYGYSGGALGTTNGGQKIALSWDSSGNVSVPTKLSAGPGMTGTPLAYGVVNSDGTCPIAKSSNVTACSWNSGSSYYEITISGVDFDFTQYITLVTPSGYNFSTPTFAMAAIVGSSPNRHLQVNIFNTSNALVQRAFNFAIFKP